MSGSFAALTRPFWSKERETSGTLAARVFSTHSGTVQCLVEPEGRVRAITPNARQLLGEASERAAELGFTLADLIQPIQPTLLQQHLQTAFSGTPASLLCAVRANPGHTRWLELRAERAPAELPGCALVEIRDVTPDASEQLRASALSAALARSPDSVLVADAAGTITWVNAAFERTSGYMAAEVVGHSMDMLRSGRHRPDFYDQMWALLRAGEPFAAEMVNRRADGSYYHEDLVITPVRDASGGIAHFVMLGRDISDRKHFELELEERAYYDMLTGVPNFRLLQERSKQILALARRHGHTAALLHIDISRLAAVNQALGHGMGDMVLRTVAERLRQGLRESDTLARLSSDEFLVLLSAVAEEESTARVVKRLRESVCRPFHLQEHSITLDAHIGVAMYPQDATTFDELAECASLAMERARQTAGSFEFYSRELNAITLEKLSLEDDYRWAWEHDQFVLHYQPICSTSDGEMVGAEALARGDVIGLEALARWPHLERGMIMPSYFIPLAERTGRIVALDRWAIATSIKQAASWAQKDWRGWVSVNLSARTLHDADLPGYIERTLHTYGLQPARLVVEITESTAMRDPAVTARVLHALKDVGVVIAVDDFGIGHSSLSYLKNFPVDLLKLDSSFIEGLGVDRRDEDLLEIMISLAHRIGARAVAEGVERQEQWEWLKRSGCDYIQGYLIGRPGPANGGVPTPSPECPAPGLELDA